MGAFLALPPNHEIKKRTYAEMSRDNLLSEAIHNALGERCLVPRCHGYEGI